MILLLAGALLAANQAPTQPPTGGEPCVGTQDCPGGLVCQAVLQGAVDMEDEALRHCVSTGAPTTAPTPEASGDLPFKPTYLISSSSAAADVISTADRIALGSYGSDPDLPDYDADEWLLLHHIPPTGTPSNAPTEAPTIPATDSPTKAPTPLDHCEDGRINDDDDETDVDCGGGCSTKCSRGQRCEKDSDCEDGISCFASFFPDLVVKLCEEQAALPVEQPTEENEQVAPDAEVVPSFPAGLGPTMVPTAIPTLFIDDNDLFSEDAEQSQETLADKMAALEQQKMAEATEDAAEDAAAAVEEVEEEENNPYVPVEDETWGVHGDQLPPHRRRRLAPLLRGRGTASLE